MSEVHRPHLARQRDTCQEPPRAYATVDGSVDVVQGPRTPRGSPIPRDVRGGGGESVYYLDLLLPYKNEGEKVQCNVSQPKCRRRPSVSTTHVLECVLVEQRRTGKGNGATKQETLSDL